MELPNEDAVLAHARVVRRGEALKTEKAKVVELAGGACEVDGIHYETLADGVAIGLLGTCGCGCPVSALALAVRLVGEEPEKRRMTLKGIGLDPESENPLIVGAAFLLMYGLDQRGVLEHGCGIMGSWPTERGMQLVELGTKALAQLEKEEREP